MPGTRFRLVPLAHMAADTSRSDPGAGPLWSPAPRRVEAANLTRFLERVAARSGFSEPRRPPLGVAAALHAWSVREPAAFWSAVWDFCGAVASAPPTRIVDDAHRMPGARWFTGARLNFAENLLTDRSAGTRRPEAIVSWNEQGRVASVGWPELCDQVHDFAAGLRRAGVRPGDHVAGLLPNIIEAVVAMLATSSLGAVWTSCSPDFGVDGVLDRFRQVEPKVLVCARGALWTGSWIDSVERVRAIAARLPSLVAVVVVGQERDGDERIVLFVVLREGLALDESLRARIRREIREGASPRHVPHVITAVPEVPRTISGKVSELAVRRTLHGLAVENLEALANPGSLVFFRDFVAPAE